MPAPSEDLDWATQRVVTQWAKAYDRFEKVFKDQLTATLNAADPRDLGGAVRRSAALAKQMEALRESIYEVAGSTSRDVVSRLPEVVARAESLELKQMIAQLPPHQFARVNEALRTGQNLVGQDVTLLRSDPRSIAAIIRRTTEQITAKNYLLSSSATRSMKQALMRAIPEGMNPKEAARLMLKNLRGEFNGGVARALTIARTEMIDAHRSAATESRRANLDVLAGWQWHADLSDRTCRACLSMHGRVFPAEQSGPDGHPNCRCTAVPVTKTWEELGIKEVQETRVVVDHREASRWFNSQPISVKRRILTQKGLDAWYEDQWDIQDWAQERTNVGWRKSWNAGVPGVSLGASYSKTYSTELLTRGNIKTRVKRVPPPKVTVQASAGAEKPSSSEFKVDTTWLDSIPKTRAYSSFESLVWSADLYLSRVVNPGHRATHGSVEYSINCSRVAAAAEMRVRGYKVTAAPKPENITDNHVGDNMDMWVHPESGKPGSFFAKWPPAGMSAREFAESVMEDAPVGSRFLVQGAWKTGGWHIWNAEVCEVELPSGKKQKVLKMYEAQVDGSPVDTYLDNIRDGAFVMMRVDDLDPTEALVKGTEKGKYTPWIEY